jgi:hypothetical protein
MKANKMNTAWMWLDGSDVRGLSIDLETQTLRWFDVVGCYCSDEDYIDQMPDTYRQDGAPPYVGSLPADIAVEIDLALAEQVIANSFVVEEMHAAAPNS